MIKFLFLTSAILMSTPYSYAGIADEVAGSFFQKKVEELKTSALACSPLESDVKAKLTVNEWMKLQPALPSWQMLANIEETAGQARAVAQKAGGSDKVRHCIAGCFIAQKQDYKSADLVGWMKELQDASDCSKNTSFEKRDYEATVLGAKAAATNKSCESYCKKPSTLKVLNRKLKQAYIIKKIFF